MVAHQMRKCCAWYRAFAHLCLTDHKSSTHNRSHKLALLGIICKLAVTRVTLHVHRYTVTDVTANMCNLLIINNLKRTSAVVWVLYANRCNTCNALLHLLQCYKLIFDKGQPGISVFGLLQLKF